VWRKKVPCRSEEVKGYNPIKGDLGEVGFKPDEGNVQKKSEGIAEEALKVQENNLEIAKDSQDKDLHERSMTNKKRKQRIPKLKIFGKTKMVSQIRTNQILL
jgi:hypothetical protein